MELAKILNKYSSENSKSVQTVYVNVFETPVGKLVCGADNNHVLFVTLDDSKNFEKVFNTLSQQLSCKFVGEKNKILLNLEEQLQCYFAGTLIKFTVPIKTIGSEFQKSVWSGLQELPYGSTQTYADLAKTLGRAPSHARAVGAACGANAHLIVIPCHRLVASGSKGGFSCGVNRKEWLLQHEQKYASKAKQ